MSDSKCAETKTPILSKVGIKACEEVPCKWHGKREEGREDERLLDHRGAKQTNGMGKQKTNKQMAWGKKWHGKKEEGKEDERLDHRGAKQT